MKIRFPDSEMPLKWDKYNDFALLQSHTFKGSSWSETSSSFDFYHVTKIGKGEEMKTINDGCCLKDKLYAIVADAISPQIQRMGIRNRIVNNGTRDSGFSDI